MFLISRDHGGARRARTVEAGAGAQGERGEHCDLGQRERARARAPPEEQGHLGHLRLRGDRLHTGPEVQDTQSRIRIACIVLHGALQNEH